MRLWDLETVNHSFTFTSSPWPGTLVTLATTDALCSPPRTDPPAFSSLAALGLNLPDGEIRQIFLSSEQNTEL